VDASGKSRAKRCSLFIWTRRFLKACRESEAPSQAGSFSPNQCSSRRTWTTRLGTAGGGDFGCLSMTDILVRNIRRKMKEAAVNEMELETSSLGVSKAALE
jgi:hypothetical protein